ncbi:DUF4124 domain-containing protein [Thiomonas arsenitoxydans]|uniref:DUF4124 domain-containing protein n=1 Tax=Thiomonas arsenitoxydans (strain DSM 22701 / CIP 110005 / 3As) TaxID=426114 RepID=UPI003A520BD3
MGARGCIARCAGRRLSLAHRRRYNRRHFHQPGSIEMRSDITIALLLAAVASSPVAAQQIFKCTENGKTVFSDHPCGETARELDVRPARRSHLVQLHHQRPDLRAQRLGSSQQAGAVGVDAEPAQGATRRADDEVRAGGVRIPFFVLRDRLVAPAEFLVEGGHGFTPSALRISLRARSAPTCRPIE